MGRMRVHIGAYQPIEIGAYLGIVHNTIAVLADLDRRFNPKGLQSMRWLLTEVRTGSFVLDIQSVPLRVDQQVDTFKEVSLNLIKGLDTLEVQAEFPEFFS